MSNDENKSLQQNLPLSWEEDSQNNLEEQAPPKKLLLKREETQTDSFQDEFEAEPTAVPVAPKPLLLKKAPAEAEDEYRKEQDNLDTIYDKEIPSDPEDYEEEYDEEEWQEEEAELEEESSELENETDSFGIVDNSTDDDFNLGNAEESELETDSDIEESSLEDEHLPATEDDAEESSLEDEDLPATEDNAEESSLEDEHLPATEDDAEESSLEDEDLPATEDDAEDDYANAFEDSGTFTLDESIEESDEPKTPLFEEDDIEENRLEIPEGGFNEPDSKDEDEETVEESPEESLEEEAEDQAATNAEESVFALKADTYYEVQTENGSSDNSDEESTPSVVIQDYEVQSMGSLLQEARLSCSFTIKDAAETTRIKSSYIIALENNEMDELPAKVYVFNYIRQLCREYNVPNEPIIKAFENQNDNGANGSDVKIMRVGNEDARKATKPKSKLNTILVGTSILVLCVLFLLSWYMKWFNPVATPDTIKIEINLEDVRPEVKLPAPELPIPSQ